jgi:hypothetical protein
VLLLYSYIQGDSKGVCIHIKGVYFQQLLQHVQLLSYICFSFQFELFLFLPQNPFFFGHNYCSMKPTWFNKHSQFSTYYWAHNLLKYIYIYIYTNTSCSNLIQFHSTLNDYTTHSQVKVMLRPTASHLLYILLGGPHKKPLFTQPYPSKSQDFNHINKPHLVMGF